MLKIEIFEKPEPEKTPTLMLSIRVLPSGTFEVFACDGRGVRLPDSTLWKLFPSGRQECPDGISRSLGLHLDRVRGICHDTEKRP